MEAAEKYLKQAAEAVKRELDELVKADIRWAEERLKSTVNDLIEASKVILPIDVAKILSEGGHVLAKEVEVNFDTDWLSFSIMDRSFRIPHLNKGKYRIIVVFERIGDVK